LGTKRGNQLLDLALALVAREIDQMVMIVWREMRRQQADRRECHVACFEPLEQDWISTRRAGGLDSAIGRVLGQVEHLRAATSCKVASRSAAARS
jgi:hypothetical protein